MSKKKDPLRFASAGGDIEATATRTARRFAFYMFGIIGLFLVLFSLWASHATLDVITRGDGKVIPTGQNKVVQHLEGGIVAAILVREGDTVRAGQILLRVDNTISKASVGEKRAPADRRAGPPRDDVRQTLRPKERLALPRGDRSDLIAIHHVDTGGRSSATGP